MAARLMTESDLGSYRFIVSSITILTNAFTFGLFSSAGTLLAGPGTSTFRTLVARGACTQAWLVSIACTLYLGGFLITHLKPGASSIWLMATLFGSAMAWPLLLQEVLRASGNFIGLAVLNAAPTALFPLLLGAAYLLAMPLDAALCATLYFLSQGMVVAGLISHYRIASRPHRPSYAYLLKRNRTLGLNIYWASFLGALTAQSGVFVLQVFRSPAEIAVFALALTVTAPLTMLPSAVGTAYFSRLPSAPGFPHKVLRNAWAASTIMAAAFSLAVPFAIQILYGDRYASVVTPAQMCGIGALLHGMGDVYNRYYLANQDTRFLLFTVSIVCIVSLALGLPAGYLFGAPGVAAARMFSSGTYVAFLYYHYHIASRRFGTLDGRE